MFRWSCPLAGDLSECMEGENVDFRAGGYIQIEAPPHIVKYSDFLVFDVSKWFTLSYTGKYVAVVNIDVSIPPLMLSFLLTKFKLLKCIGGTCTLLLGPKYLYV